MTNTVRTVISYISWPLLLVLCIAATVFGFKSTHPVLAFNVVYLCLITSLFLLERYMPHEQKWRESDGQLFADLAHTLLSKGVVQAIIGFAGIFGLTTLITPLTDEGYGIWPRHWPLAAQVVLGLVTAEFGLYWAHRLSHEFHPLWRFHAVHHSVTKLWIVNTGRFHFINSLVSILLGTGVLIALGAPLEVVLWLSAITAYIGVLTHCNVEMNFIWPLSYIFNTPELHRWHHSKKLREGNKNYSENIMIWDHVFRSFYIDTGRRPPTNIGITQQMPESFWEQLVWPFRDLSLKFKPYDKKTSTKPLPASE
ncbi:MAG: sterol desaturase [Micavibrio aeruginosavorus]|uniref:Sterol desaturase n=1 Tax=Micavibrio aeruginosavorus TaxID=349221 RepID=A0A2W5MQZ9_9BACT|nr:MAG: sterol desaturase [Micavibrio aeruginosavorus]